MAVEVLISRGVPEERILFLNLIASPEGIENFASKFPKLRVVTAFVDAGLDEKKYVGPDGFTRTILIALQLYHSRSWRLWRQILHNVIIRRAPVGEAGVAATPCIDSINISEIEKLEIHHAVKQQDIVTSRTKVHSSHPIFYVRASRGTSSD
jgi:hypothetical protein